MGGVVDRAGIENGVTGALAGREGVAVHIALAQGGSGIARALGFDLPAIGQRHRRVFERAGVGGENDVAGEVLDIAQHAGLAGVGQGHQLVTGGVAEAVAGGEIDRGAERHRRQQRRNHERQGNFVAEFHPLHRSFSPGGRTAFVRSLSPDAGNATRAGQA